MPPSAGWPLRSSRLRRAVGRSDGWSVLRWGEFRTGSVQDALGARDLQKKDLASSGQSELTSCERRACLLPWQLMPITAWTNQTHPSTWTRWRASGGLCAQYSRAGMCFRDEQKKNRDKGRKWAWRNKDICELFRMISSYKFWPLKMIRKSTKVLKDTVLKDCGIHWNEPWFTEIKLINQQKNLK